MRKLNILLFMFVGLAMASAQADVYPEYQDDSFGRVVRYLGMVNAGGVAIVANCSPGPECVEPQPGGTWFERDNMEAVHLPANSTLSMICVDLTPTVNWQYAHDPNVTTSLAGLTASAKFRVENEVLDDPDLIDPSTGMPFNGGFNRTVTMVSEETSLPEGATQSRHIEYTRSCLEPLVSRQALLDMGLKESQADEFFQKPITIRFGISGFAYTVPSAHIFYGVRLYGDR